MTRRSWAKVSQPWAVPAIREWLKKPGWCIVAIDGQWHVMELPPTEGDRNLFIVPAAGARGFARCLAVLEGLAFRTLPEPPAKRKPSPVLHPPFPSVSPRTSCLRR